MSVELKIKSKHLSEEAKIIRFEEHKLRKQITWLEDHQRAEEAFKLHTTWLDVKDHRRKDVRNENRSTFLARAYIAGKSYHTIEAKVHDVGTLQGLVVTRVAEMVAKYGRGMRKTWNRDKKAYIYDEQSYNMLKKELLAWIES